MVVCVCNLPYERGSGGPELPGGPRGLPGRPRGASGRHQFLLYVKQNIDGSEKKWLKPLREAIFILEKLDLNWTPGGRSGRPGRASKNVNYHFFGR